MNLRQAKFIAFQVLFLLILAYEPFAQTSNLKRLNIGDQVPDIEFNNLLNYLKTKVKLSDFRGRLLILDFWNQRCVPCINGFPKMEKLQNEFHGKIQVLLVSNEKSADLKDLFKKSKTVRETQLPFLFEAKELYQLFPHTSEPFHVWIDKDGKVAAITSGYNSTFEHIRNYLDGKNPYISIRTDIMDLNLNNYTLLFEEGNGRLTKHIQFSSILLNHLQGYEGSGYEALIDSLTQKPIGLRFINFTLLGLCRSAWEFSDSKDRIILNVSNPQDYLLPNDENYRDAWTLKNTYCYEIKVPPDRISFIKQYMRQDLEKFFNIKANREKRLLKCLILVKNSGENKLKTAGGEIRNEKTKRGYIFRNTSIRGGLIGNILTENRDRITCPIIDETDYKGNVDLDIDTDFTDLLALRKELSKYGLDLVEGYRELEVLVIYESKEKHK